MKTQDIKLYNIPRESKIYCEVSDGSKYVIFMRLDGAYSFCVPEKEVGKEQCTPAHLHACTPLVKYKDGYKILNTDDDDK